MKTCQPELKGDAPTRGYGRIQLGDCRIPAATPGTGGEDRVIWSGSQSGERTGFHFQNADRQGFSPAMGMTFGASPAMDVGARISYAYWLGAIAVGIMLWSIILRLF